LFVFFYLTSIIWYSVKWFVLPYSFSMSVNEFLLVLEKFLETAHIVKCYAFSITLAAKKFQNSCLFHN